MSQQKGHLVWMDMEMTGLNPDVEVIIEIATLITDADLNLVAEGPVLAISQPDTKLAAMDDWNQKHHGESGLIERVRQSQILTREAEAQTLAFIQAHVAEQASPLCGNSVWQDRRFLRRYMPSIDGYLHYRNLDVSTVKELAQRWRPDILSGFSKHNAHTALADIRESVAELRHYRQHFFRLEAP